MKDTSDLPKATNAPRQSLRKRSQVDLEIRAELGNQLREILIKTDLKQKEIAKLLSVQQPEVSHLINGHFTRFTIGKLIQFLDQLGWSVTFTLCQRQFESH
ncbi:MAG: XRE family transcriptional regulator [Cyanobacteria bacterium P01_A01_bin.3]